MKRRGQHHLALAWLVAGGLGVGAATVLSSLFLPHESLWHALAAPQEDGTWQFTMIDDRYVRADGYSVRIHWGEVIAGYDGCNNWGTSDGNVLDNGERIITIDLQECASQPTDEAYLQLTRATATMTLKGSRLMLHDELHRGELRRVEAR